MNTIVLTNSNAGTSQKHKLSLKLTNPMRLENSYLCVSDISLYYSWPNIKSSYRNNTFKYKRTTDNQEFEVKIPDGSYQIKDINSYLRHVMRHHGEKEDDKNEFPIEMYANNVYQRVTVETKPNYILQIPITGFGQVVGFTRAAQDNDKYVSIGPNKKQNGDEIPQIEHVESVLVHCNLVDNRYVLENSLIYSFTPSLEFGLLLNERPNLAQWRHARNNADINEIEVWFTDQDNKPLDIQDPKIRVELQIKDATTVI